MEPSCEKTESFWASTFSKEGCQSWGRVAAFVALIMGLAWTTRLVLLITSPDQFDKLSALAIFIGAVTAMVGTLYGISKGLDVRMEKVKGADNATV